MSDRPVPVTCLGCKKVRQCILVQALTPFRDDKIYSPCGRELKRPIAENAYEVAASLFVCKECLKDPLCPLAKFVADAAR